MVTVLTDGFGDLYNCLNAVRLVKEEYPDWIMKFFINTYHPVQFNMKEFGLTLEDCLVIQNNAERKWIKLKLNNANPDELKVISKFNILQEEKIEEFINVYNEADLHISVSVPTKLGAGLRAFGDKSSSSKFVSFLEYGSDEWNTDLLKNTLCMGVAPSSCGIYFLNSNPPENFTSSILNKYFRQKEKIYFNYGWDIQGYASLVSRINPNAKKLNIITNTSLENIEEMHIEGVERILYVDREGVEKTLKRIDKTFLGIKINSTSMSTSATAGKILRFINPFPLEHGDMALAISLSEEPVGITGNNTFSESLDRLPFYNNRSCLSAFWDQLIYLANKATPQNILLIDYLKQMSYKKEGENSNVFLQAEDLLELKEQWGELVAILRRDWNVKDAYLGEINRRIQENKIIAHSRW